jgi:hypothetical protein
MSLEEVLSRLSVEDGRAAPAPGGEGAQERARGATGEGGATGADDAVRSALYWPESRRTALSTSVLLEGFSLRALPRAEDG